MKYLFLDTETTGLVNFSKDARLESQPHLAQIGLALCNETGRVIESHGMIVRPNGWVIPIRASEVHGITTEMALDCGVLLESALDIYKELLEDCNMVIAHNYAFDSRVMAANTARLQIPLMTKPSFCTMLASTPILKLPGSRGYKWPKLSEAYEYFFEEELKDTHDAMSDVIGCKRIFFEGLKGPQKFERITANEIKV